MKKSVYFHLADALVFAHGENAEHEARLHAWVCEETGDKENAAYWRKMQSELATNRLATATYLMD